MWFDPYAELAKINGDPPATSATTATQSQSAPQMSQVSRLSQAPVPQNNALPTVPPSAMTTQECNRHANEILDALGNAQTGEELSVVMAQNAEIIAAIEIMPEPLASVRAIHIRNLEAMKRKELKAYR